MVKAHAGAGDRVKIGSLRHHFEPASGAISEELGFIDHVFGVTAIEEGGQVYLWAWPPCVALPLNPRHGGFDGHSCP